jgi:SAM-dependent methyltransferase
VRSGSPPSLRRLLSAARRAQADPPSADEDFVDQAYRLVLRRQPDTEARAAAAAGLAAGSLSRSGLVADLTASEEAARVRQLDEAVARGLRARAGTEPARWLQGPPGSDERVIELAWVLARYAGERRVLDAGSAHAEPAYVEALLATGAEVTGVDLAPSTAAGMRVVEADLRRLPLDDASFDLGLCVSTLEHVGSDNARYGVERGHGGMIDALRELGRVLAPTGRLLVTVPCGEERDHGWFVERPPDAWLALFQQAGLVIAEEELYELLPEGWRSVDALSGPARYGERGPAAGAVLCADLRPAR